MTPLDLYRSPLTPGIHLVEASAGTGKTYSIAQLVVRFLVEGISVEEMGVVTFTRAATAELRQRIGERLLRVRSVLAGEPTEDRALREWVENLADRSMARRRIEAELLKLDLMPIQTIHGFCQQALRQQALEAGELLGQTMLEEDGTLIQAIVDDLWRGQELATWQWRRILDLVPTPDALAELLKRWRPPLRFVPEVAKSKGEGPPNPCEELAPISEAQWQAFASWMDELCAAQLLKKEARQWWEKLRAESTPPQRLIEVKLRQDLLAFLGRQLNQRKAKSLEELEGFPRHYPVLAALEQLGHNQAWFVLAWVQRAWHHLQAEYDRRLRRKGQLTHDFVVRRLAEIVEQTPMSTLKSRFKVFFIDEFQDTDRYQWIIFSQLFGRGGHFLFLIGDPKQSIYRFRGADLDTYFEAARMAHRRWHLTTNFRSHPCLVAAINCLFEKKDAFLHPELTFFSVQAGRQREKAELRCDGRAVVPFWWQAFEVQGEPYRYRRRDEAIAQLAYHAAGDIACWLSQYRIVESGEERGLRPGDIAILVRDNETAGSVRRVLREYRLPAVLIDRRSVYETDTAKKLYRLLVTLWEGPDWSRVKRVLADGWFGVDASQLVQIEQGEAATPYLEAFIEAAERWRSDGLIVALEGLFGRFKVWKHIASSRYGTRTLADLRHLLELLQAKGNQRRLAPQALLNWYVRRLNRPAGESEQLRLESDEDAIKLVTMHSAKGLEYPVVLCFDLWLPPNPKQTDPVTVGERVVFQVSSEYETAFAGYALAERQEAMRLTYVALTRAKAAVCVYVLEKQQNPTPWSPLRHLLVQDAGDDSFLAARRLAQRQHELFVYQRRPLREPPLNHWCPTHRLSELQEPKPLGRNLHQEVRILTSYSGLVRGRLHVSSSDWIERLLEEGVVDDGPLPRGAAFGSLLHALLEQVPFSELAHGQADDRLWQQLTRQVGFGVDLEKQKVLSLLQRAVTTPLPEFTLAEVDPSKQLHELEFFLPIRSLTASDLNALLAGEAWFRKLVFPEVKGFIRGFIDLVVEHRGRFYVLDYKSNQLESYAPSSLVLAMREHDYGLQAMLYALALHRHLKARLPGYDYEAHFGGVRYLFLRGMDGRPGEGVFSLRPEKAQISALEACLYEPGAAP